MGLSRELLASWSEKLPPDTVFAGRTAAWLHGLDLDSSQRVEVATPLSRGVRTKRGLYVRHLILARSDVTTVRGLRATSLPRTLRDLCVSEPRVEALVAIDMALRCRRASKDGLRTYVSAGRRKPGNARLRRLVEMAEPAESPMETRLRWLLHRRGLPTPEVQVDLHDDEGTFLGRADLYYPPARLVIEFDGGNHRDRLVSDDRRQNLLIGAGFTILRFTATDLYQQPDGVVAQVRAAWRRGRDSNSRWAR